MKPASSRQVFWVSVLTGVIVTVAWFGFRHWTEPPRLPLDALTPEVWVAEQLQLEAIPKLRGRFQTIVDLRPDGEAVDQPPSADVAVATRAARMQFFYVPVPHGDIPEEAVAALAKALAASPKPILLYCRSGRRAVRTWSLVEASRQDGLDAKAILAAAKAAGQSVDDLNEAIVSRVSRRPQTAGGSR